MALSAACFPTRPLAPRHGVCRSCFDLYAQTRSRDGGRCHACARGVHRSADERAAIQSFWVENPTRVHLIAFAEWGRERDLARARRNLDRFWRRAYRWSARPEAGDR
ncbi:MAG: hypothetical protein IPK07_18550 [Deltaproteobacteria bacterium]|nr:hypothetical protein [Deltaproteobacteria bacterium]